MIEAVDLTKEFAEITSVITDAIDEVRTIAHNLRPYQLDRLGLTRALHSLVGKINESSPTSFTCTLDNIDTHFSSHSSILIFRIIQEAFTNVLKHANAMNASLIIKNRVSAVHIIIHDNGRGFPEGRAVNEQSGFGLSSIDQRVRILHGTLTVTSVAGQGTTLTMTIPVQS